jgi:UPF0716 protein FxsA
VRWLLLLFVIVPLAELYLLLYLGSILGFWTTVAITLITGVLGGALAKHEGLRVWDAWRRSLDELRPPEQGVIDGVLVLLGGALLITPGVMTDVVGLLLLLPWSSSRVAQLVRQQIDHRLSVRRMEAMGDIPGVSAFPGVHDEPPSGVVDTEGEDVDSTRS